MNNDYLSAFIDRLRLQGHSLAPGLSDSEVSRVENQFGFQFPPDLKEFLQQILPVSPGWVDWRNGATSEIQARLDWPLDGMIFDIEHNTFWLDAWGKKPAVLAEAIAIAKAEVAKAPTLIPIWYHRYLPDNPPLAGNPVFSVSQTDIIYYGYDLASYFENEFPEIKGGIPTTDGYQSDMFQKTPLPIRFWDDVIGENF